MATWDDLEQKYAAPAAMPDAAPASDPWASLEQKYAAPQATVSTPAPAEKDVGLLDRVRAGAAGINKGFYSDLLGLPVDTAANVVDLAKAGYGAAATAFGRPDLAPKLTDRSKVIGSSDWIASKINDVGMGAAINNPNPQDAVSRIAYTGGRVGGSSIVPVRSVPISVGQNALNVGKGIAGGLAAGTVGEVAPDWAGVAGLVPSAATASSAAGIKRLVRGNEQGRQNMAQRVQDFKNAGVDEPSVGLASGNRAVQGIENTLSLTPGSAGVFESSKQKMLDGMQAKSSHLRDSISPIYGPVEAGSAIQSDLKGPFKQRIGDTYGLLNDKVEQVVGTDTPVPVNESIVKSGLITTPVPGAEATSSNFINGRIKKINSDLIADAGGTPAQVINSTILGPNGQPAAQTIIPATPPQGVPFSALKDLRTKIGKESASNAIMGTPEQADFKQLYGAMSSDMKNGVALADLQNGVMPTSPGSATTALNRANTYYARGMQRADDLNPIANRTTPEGAYGSVSNSLNSGPSIYQRLRGVIQPQTRQKIVATVIDDLGKATPGQQGAAGDTWSPKTFLTNYNRLDSSSQAELFKRLPNGAQAAASLRDIAKAADMIGQGSKVWANPSGTAAALTSRGTMYALTVGAYFQPMLAAGTAAGLLTANAASRLLVNPKFVNWLAKVPTIKPQDMQAYQQRLIANIRMTNDPQLKQDVEEYLSSVKQGVDDS